MDVNTDNLKKRLHIQYSQFGSQHFYSDFHHQQLTVSNADYLVRTS